MYFIIKIYHNQSVLIIKNNQRALIFFNLVTTKVYLIIENRSQPQCI